MSSTSIAIIFEAIVENIPECWELLFLGNFESDPNEANIAKRITKNIIICFAVFFGGLETLKE
jgi:hypothetical protein